MASSEKDLLVNELHEEWGLVVPDIISEEAILQNLEHRVVTLIEKGPETFFQLMYRLDISEKKLNMVMHNDEAARNIARLIYDRQLQKIQSRLNSRKVNTDEDPELQW
ncbi:MAG: hypothetical protein WCG87_12325 [Bacteroidota bacterium]